MSYKLDGESTEVCDGRSKEGKLIFMQEIRKYFTEKVAVGLVLAAQKEFGNRDVEERLFK